MKSLKAKSPQWSDFAHSTLLEFSYPDQLRLAAPLASPEALGMSILKGTAPTDAVGCTIDRGPEATMEILPDDFQRPIAKR